MPEDSNHSDLAPREETAVQPSPLPQAKPAAFESAINSHRFDVSFDLAELCNDAHVQVHAAVIKQADGTGKRSVSEKSWKKLLRDIARIIRLAEVPYFEFARASKETDEQAHIWAKSELRQVVYSELGLEDKQTPESTIFFKWAGDGSPDFASYHYVHGWNEPWRAYQWSVALRPRQLTAGQMLRVDWAADMSTLRASEKHTEAFLKRKKEELEKAIEIALLQAANQVRQRIARGSRLATAAEMTAPQASGADHARPGTRRAIDDTLFHAAADAAVSRRLHAPATERATTDPQYPTLTTGEAFAGKLFYDAWQSSSGVKAAKKKGAKKQTISREALFNIAIQLDSDKSLFRDPREHLPAACHTELAKYNQNHPRAAITTWLQVARHRSFSRGMRRLGYVLRDKYKDLLSKQHLGQLS